MAYQYNTNSFDKELSFVFYRAKKYHFQQNLLLLMVISAATRGHPHFTDLHMFRYETLYMFEDN